MIAAHANNLMKGPPNTMKAPSTIKLAPDQVDISFTEKMVTNIPYGHIVVSESGIFNRSDVELLRKLKVHAMLVGEALMTADDIGKKVRELALGLN